MEPETPKKEVFSSNLPYAVQIQTPPPNGDHVPMAMYTGGDGRERDVNGIRLGDWESEFCGCCTHPVPNGWMSLCFPCITIAQIVKRLGLYSYHKCLAILVVIYAFSYILDTIRYNNMSYSYSIEEDDGSVVWARRNYYDEDEYWEDSYTYGFYGTGYMSTIFSIVIGVIVFRLRVYIRHRFNIPGNMCVDCLAAWFCSWCALAQMASHVQSYKPGSCDFGAPDTLPAYPVDQNGMTAV